MILNATINMIHQNLCNLCWGIIILGVLVGGLGGLGGCAQTFSPTGGPKDAKPPQLLEQKPSQGSTLFQGDRLEWTFDERIGVGNLRQGLIISPTFPLEMVSHKVRRNKLIILLDSALDANQMYRFDLSGLVHDVTERNPVTILQAAFSTGAVVDSLIVTGLLTRATTNKPVQAIVGLIPQEDSVALATWQPRYIAQSKANGLYTLEYLPEGSYYLIAFEDKNRNRKLESEQEWHAFAPEVLVLTAPIAPINLPDSSAIAENNEGKEPKEPKASKASKASKDSVSVSFEKNLALTQGNTRPLRFINQRTSGSYAQLIYNKGLFRYNVRSVSAEDSLVVGGLNHYLSGARRVIQWGGDSALLVDSLWVIVQAEDSLKQRSQDTIWWHNNRLQSGGLEVEETWAIDDAYFQSHARKEIELVATFNQPMHTDWVDSLLRYKEDTVVYPIAIQGRWEEKQTQWRGKIQVLCDTLEQLTGQVLVLDSAFMSLDSAYSTKQEIKVPVINPTNYGTLVGRLKSNFTQQGDWVVELLNSKYEVLRQSIGAEFRMEFLKPGSYLIRVWIDRDGNGLWFSGNILMQQVPEPIWVHKEKINVRANWVLEDVEIPITR